jgi:two-component system response regulator AtoC
VRELENALEHALILSDEDQIRVHSLPHVLQTEANSFGDLNKEGAKLFFEYIQTHRDADQLSIKRLTQALEESLIREALSRTGGVKTQAAKMLEISTKTLLYKLRDY